jgi:AbiJ N-terminal domain 4
MAINDIYYKRRRRDLGELPDVLSYDRFPAAFRVQASFIIQDLLGTQPDHRSMYDVQRAYRDVVEVLRRELGVVRLAPAGSEYDELHTFVQGEPNVDKVLSAIELACNVADERARRRDYRNVVNASKHVDAAFSELNARFTENAVGYQFEEHVIVRTDSHLIHQEAVRPALRLLSDPTFKGAEEEMLQAFEHHRHGKEKDVLVWCLKAFESTLKIICAKRGWTIASKGQAKDLLDAVFANNLIEPIWQSEFSALRGVLESGVPTGRNKRGGHGQGADPLEVPGHMATFVLHQTAAAIVFFVESEKALPT